MTEIQRGEPLPTTDEFFGVMDDIRAYNNWLTSGNTDGPQPTLEEVEQMAVSIVPGAVVLSRAGLTIGNHRFKDHDGIEELAVGRAGLILADGALFSDFLNGLSANDLSDERRDIVHDIIFDFMYQIEMDDTDGRSADGRFQPAVEALRRHGFMDEAMPAGRELERIVAAQAGGYLAGYLATQYFGYAAEPVITEGTDVTGWHKTDLLATEYAVRWEGAVETLDDIRGNPAAHHLADNFGNYLISGSLLAITDMQAGGGFYPAGDYIAIADDAGRALRGY